MRPSPRARERRANSPRAPTSGPATPATGRPAERQGGGARGVAESGAGPSRVGASGAHIVQASSATHKRIPFARAGVLRAATALLWAGACATPRASTGGLRIVVHGAPFAGVEAAAVAESSVRWTDGDPADDDACTESYAAVELASLLRHCPGVGAREIVLSSADRLPAGDCMVLGNPRSQPLMRSLLPREAWPDSGARDAFRIRAIARDGRRVWIVCGASRRGTLYGAYALLERLGVRFYGPPDSETVLPRDPVALPVKLDLASSPAVETRGFWALEPRGNTAFLRWMARRRMNLWTSVESDVPLLRKLGIRLVGGGHSLQADYLGPRSPS